MTNERPGGVTIKGNPLTVLGDPVEVGSAAPDFSVTKNDLSTMTLADTAGKTRLISVVPSLDTGICHAQTVRFNEEAGKLGDDVAVITISAEHPFNQKRWCGAEGVENMDVVSDHMSMSFGNAYGLAIKEWRLLQRAIFVVDANDTVTYTEYIPEIAQFPDYDAALEALKSAAG